MKRTGVVRIGYNSNNIPFSFTNNFGNLVGFDIENAHKLALSLQAKIDLIPTELADATEKLKSGRIDIYMSGVLMSSKIYENAMFINPHLDSILCILVHDHDRDLYKSWNDIEKTKGKNVGVYQHYYILKKLEVVWPDSNLKMFKQMDELNTAMESGLDLLILNAELAHTMAQQHPEYHVITPTPTVNIPFGYLTRKGDFEFASYVFNFIRINEALPEHGLAVRQWLKGENIVKEKRWNIWQDLFEM